VLGLILAAGALACAPEAAVKAPAEPDTSPAWVIDAPIGGVLAPSATSSVRGLLSPSLRVTHLHRPGAGTLRFGLEGAIFAMFEDDGTDRIRASSWSVGAEVSGLTGWAYGSQKARFMPNLWVSALAAGGESSRRVDETVESRPLILGGLLLGAGLQIQVYWFSLRLDFGMGALGPETTGRARAAVGAAF
jgi:hypothetical protein